MIEHFLIFFAVPFCKFVTFGKVPRFSRVFDHYHDKFHLFVICNIKKCVKIYKGFPNRGDMILNVPIGLI